jgi:hypothetical protein
MTLGCLKPIQILYVPMVDFFAKKHPDLVYLDTDKQEVKCELKIAIYY